MEDTPHLYEAITLLALREEAGTVVNSSTFPFAVAGALVAELLTAGRLRVEESGKGLVEAVDGPTIGDPLLDECLQRVRTSRRRARLRDWVMRFAHLRGLKARAVAGLCQRGILRLEEKDVLLVFKQKVYPEIDPRPERAIVARLRRAIFGETTRVEPDTVVLVALAQAADLLRVHFERAELKQRKARIKALVSGSLAGKATEEAIQAMQAAVVAVSIATTAAAAR